MKRDVLKWIAFILVGALCCKIKMMACYPFVAIWFVSVYMEEMERRVFVSFMYLWMVLWLPIASFLRYAIALLVWMVVLLIGKAMHVHLRRMGQAVLAGLILVAVSYGGTVLSVVDEERMLLYVFEGTLVAGASILVNRPVAFVLEWKANKKEVTEQMPEVVRGYSAAMTDLAKSMEMLVKPQARTDDGKRMHQELYGRICASCQHSEMCYGETGTMALVMDELWQVYERGEQVGEELEKRIYKQCERAELLMQEALNVVEKLELNRYWYQRMCEHREMIASQIDAMALAMGDVLEQEENCDEKERWHIHQIKYHMKDIGVGVSNAHIYRCKNGATHITMEMVAKWGGCITMKEVVEQLNASVSQPMIACEENRSIVGKEKALYAFVTKPKLTCTHGVAKLIRGGETISGDSFRAGPLVSGRYVMALSDGMGSGRQANIESETVVDLFWRFLASGFALDVSLRLMNAAMIFGAGKERFSTLDACIVDEYTGVVDIYKIGAHVSFIKRKNHVEVIGAESLPLGAEVEVDTVPNRTYLQPGDYLVMVTDGVLEYLQAESPVEVLQDLMEDLSDTDAGVFSRKLMERILLFCGGKVQDDMTILTLRTEER